MIHRDLKPSNVLLTEQQASPGQGDRFRIAKATDQRAIENTLITQFGQMVGTPEYASPEQAEVTTGDVDETSDVYSLGVLLEPVADRHRSLRLRQNAEVRFSRDAPYHS